MTKEDSETARAMALFRGNRDEAAIAFLEERLDQDDDSPPLLRGGRDRTQLAAYKLATIVLKTGIRSLTRKEIERVIGLYTAVMKAEKDFAPAYFMCGVAYYKLASVLLGEYKAAPYTNPDDKVGAVERALGQAKTLMKKSTKLDPRLIRDVKPYLDGYQERLDNLRDLKSYYKDNQHEFN